MKCTSCPERMLQIVWEKNFSGFDVSNRPAILELVTFTEYEHDFELPIGRELGLQVIGHGGAGRARADNDQILHGSSFLSVLVSHLVGSLGEKAGCVPIFKVFVFK